MLESNGALPNCEREPEDKARSTGAEGAAHLQTQKTEFRSSGLSVQYVQPTLLSPDVPVTVLHQRLPLLLTKGKVTPLRGGKGISKQTLKDDAVFEVLAFS